MSLSYECVVCLINNNESDIELNFDRNLQKLLKLEITAKQKLKSFQKLLIY